nr:MAG TPA: hypothetical protein [Caudoviricetes sp.]
MVMASLPMACLPERSMRSSSCRRTTAGSLTSSSRPPARRTTDGA